MTPGIAQIVHYTAQLPRAGEDPEHAAKECQAAIVTAGRGEGVDLTVFAAGRNNAWYIEIQAEHLANKIEPGPSGRTAGTWHWPEQAD